MHDFKSRELCSFGPRFASCFKKMKNSKMKNSKMKKKTQTQFQMMDNKSRLSFMFGDLATEVAIDIKYRIGELKSLTA